jgi:mRNA-degrading endonuclease RelE of RelBE toxin-antitoxin system
LTNGPPWLFDKFIMKYQIVIRKMAMKGLKKCLNRDINGKFKAYFQGHEQGHGKSQGDPETKADRPLLRVSLWV